MVDTEGSEVHTNELEQPIKAEVSYCCALQRRPYALTSTRPSPPHDVPEACRPLTTPCIVQVGSEYTFTIRDPSTVKGIAFGVSYDAFIDDVQVRCLQREAL